MLEENARVALMIGESLRDQTIQMGLYEMENLLNRCAFMRVMLRAACQAFCFQYVIKWALASRHFHLPSFTSQISRGSGGIRERASQGPKQQQKQVLPPLSAGLHQQLHHPQVR